MFTQKVKAVWDPLFQNHSIPTIFISEFILLQYFISSSIHFYLHLWQIQTPCSSELCSTPSDPRPANGFEVLALCCIPASLLCVIYVACPLILIITAVEPSCLYTHELVPSPFTQYNKFAQSRVGLCIFAAHFVWSFSRLWRKLW